MDLCGSEFDTVVSVHTGCPGTPVNEDVCDDGLLPWFRGWSPHHPPSIRWRDAAGWVGPGTTYIDTDSAPVGEDLTYYRVGSRMPWSPRSGGYWIALRRTERGHVEIRWRPTP